MKRLIPVIIVFLMILSLPVQTEASFFSDALAKARKVMQGAFQMTFLPSIPVIFHKQSFNRLFDHAQKSIDNINLKHGDKTISRDKFQDDKALHIKKSAELALHIKSLIGSAHLAYGITMVIGLVKEAIDGSFLNPNGSRSKEDVKADHVGAMAVFGEKKFDASLQKHLGTFVKEEKLQSEPVKTIEKPASHDSAVEQESFKPAQSPFADEEVQMKNESARQRLLKQYYSAAEKGDSESMKRLSLELQSLK